jgi:hypothetical protein
LVFDRLPRPRICSELGGAIQTVQPLVVRVELQPKLRHSQRIAFVAAHKKRLCHAD